MSMSPPMLMPLVAIATKGKEFGGDENSMRWQSSGPVFMSSRCQFILRIASFVPMHGCHAMQCHAMHGLGSSRLGFILRVGRGASSPVRDPGKWQRDRKETGQTPVPGMLCIAALLQRRPGMGPVGTGIGRGWQE